ncbi:NPCBM/NEW2 domain-containing protein [Pengzhenrongella sp.]|uniref:NPCBM/NEW2 domain-containing protein n=1 Tax=Pengzhenrongella sp. TaxID=2888820 RepID=UPI002F924D23
MHVVPPPPVARTALSDHPWLRATSGWNHPQVNLEVGGGPMRLGATTYEKGVGVASPSAVDYYLGSRCTGASMTIGIDDAGRGGAGGTATFTILGDGRTLYDSGVIAQAETRDVAVDLTGVDVVSFQVGDAGDGGGNDRTDWADLTVSCSS